MYVERVLSINNGWAILSDKDEQWQEMLAALRTIDDEFIIEQLAGPLKKYTTLEYLIIYLRSKFNMFLTQQSGWAHTIDLDTGLAMSGSGQKPNKNGILASILGTGEITGGDFTSNVYLAIPYYFSYGLLDVAILFIPTTDATTHFKTLGFQDSKHTTFPTEEFCRLQLARFTALNNQTPIVLAFFSPTAFKEVAVEELFQPNISGSIIERTLEFAPEYYQASVGLLAYFGSVLRQKDPNTKAKVRIEQDGNTVRLHIVPPVGKAEVVEKQLEQFALIVNGEAPPESLFDNPGQIIQLKTQLRMAQMQVETAHDLRQLSDGRITSLEKQVEFLQNQFAAQILQNNKATDLNHKVIDLATQQASSHERMQTALLTHAGMLFKDLLEESRNNFQLLTAIQNLHQNLLSGLTTLDVEDQIKQALETVKQQKPGMLARIYTQVEGAALKAGAGASLTWAADLVKHTIQTQ